MLLEEQRLIHEDLERLEEAIAERLLEDPKHVSLSHPCPRGRLAKLLIDSRSTRTRP